LPSGIIALRHLPAGRGARALVTSDGIGGTAASGGGCGRAGLVPGCGSGAAGAVIGVLLGQARIRRSVAGDRQVCGGQPAGTLRRGDGNARGR
jgi:hypothetical protein